MKIAFTLIIPGGTFIVGKRYREYEEIVQQQILVRYLTSALPSYATYDYIFENHRDKWKSPTMLGYIRRQHMHGWVECGLFDMEHARAVINKSLGFHIDNKKLFNWSLTKINEKCWDFYISKEQPKPKEDKTENSTFSLMTIPLYV